jgi:hypothetical protein
MLSTNQLVADRGLAVVLAVGRSLVSLALGPILFVPFEAGLRLRHSGWSPLFALYANGDDQVISLTGDEATRA